MLEVKANMIFIPCGKPLWPPLPSLESAVNCALELEGLPIDWQCVKSRQDLSVLQECACWGVYYKWQDRR